jgi:hypothetical protein
MFEKMNSSDSDIVYAKRLSRKENLAKKISIKLFHKIFNWGMHLKHIKYFSNFGAYENSPTPNRI